MKLTIFTLILMSVVQFAQGQYPVLVKDIAPFPNGSRPDNFTVLGNQLLFAANSYIGSTNRELYVSDSSGSGTQLLLDIVPGNNSSSPERLIAINGKVYFAAADYSPGFLVYRPWVSDGTLAGTYPLFPNANTFYESLTTPATIRAKDLFVEYHGMVYFKSTPNVAPFDNVIYKTDGTQAGTVVAIQLPNNTGLYNLLNGPIVYNDTIYFSGTSNGGANEDLYKSDGTSANTFLVKSGVTLYNFAGTAVYDNKLYFSGTSISGVNGAEPWVTDGTSLGTIEITNLNPGVTFGSNPSSFTRVNNKLLFLGSADGSSVTLYAVDSTAGTNIVNPISQISNVNLAYSQDWLFEKDNIIYFRGQDVANGAELWKSDGSTSGTGILKDIYIGTGGSSPNTFVTYCNDIYFTAQNPLSGSAQCLYKTDGTAVGTHLIPGTIADTAAAAGITAKIVYKNTLFFSGQYDINVSEELYKYTDACATIISEGPEKDKIVVSPNPVLDILSISIADNIKIDAVSVYNSMGQLLNYVVVNESKASINLELLPRGIYLVKINFNNNMISKKIIKQ